MCNPAAYLYKDNHRQKGIPPMSQREISIASLTATRASGAVVWIRLYVGLIFVGEGVLKFLRPEALGPGRFAKVDIPFSTFTAYLDGVFEIGCGLMILAGLLVRLATLPMIIDMIGALGFTKVPLLFGSAAAVPEGTRLLGLLPRRPARDRDAVRQHLPAHRRRRRLLVRRPDEPRHGIRHVSPVPRSSHATQHSPRSIRGR